MELEVGSVLKGSHTDGNGPGGRERTEPGEWQQGGLEKEEDGTRAQWGSARTSKDGTIREVASLLGIKARKGRGPSQLLVTSQKGAGVHWLQTQTPFAVPAHPESLLSLTFPLSSMGAALGCRACVM